MLRHTTRRRMLLLVISVPTRCSLEVRRRVLLQLLLCSVLRRYEDPTRRRAEFLRAFSLVFVVMEGLSRRL